ncbi:MAG: LON peptidase substrate-binding domain-containing protein [Verrucomicrobiota bacterium]
MEQNRHFGLMVLPGTVLFPHMILPLYIFEPRYRKLLAKSLSGDRLFAVAQEMNGRPADVFGTGVIRAAVRNKDGTYHILIEGVHRYRIDSLVNDSPIYEVKASQLPPNPGVESEPQIRSEIEQILERAMQNNDRLRDYMEAISYKAMDDNRFCDILASLLIQESQRRQILLEEDDLGKRLCLLHDYLNGLEG